MKKDHIDGGTKWERVEAPPISAWGRCPTRELSPSLCRVGRAAIRGKEFPLRHVTSIGLEFPRHVPGWFFPAMRLVAPGGPRRSKGLAVDRLAPCALRPCSSPCG